MIKLIIVDDEAKARKSLRSLLVNFGDSKVVAEASNATEAIQAILDFSPDVVFLDVKMPGRSGFDVLDAIDKMNKRNFEVIFLTAFDEFAIKAIRYSAFDYLLKPVDLDELKATYNRMFDRERQLPDIAVLRNALLPQVRIRIKTSFGYEMIDTNEIVYIEGDGNYATVVLSDIVRYTTCRTLKDFSIELPENFIRIHKKYIINKYHLSTYNKIERSCLLMKDNIRFDIPVSFRMTKFLR